MPRTNSSTKTHVRALQAAMATEGFTVNYTQARRIWDSTAAAAVDPSSDRSVADRFAPGAALLEAIRVLLSDQGAHVASGTPGLAPLDGAGARGEILPALGWEPLGDERYEPCGPRIGTMEWDAEARDWLILLNPVLAFTEAAKRHPQLITPDQTPASSWAAIWDEGLAAPTSRRRMRYGVPENTIRMRMGDRQETGVPVMMLTLMSAI